MALHDHPCSNFYSKSARWVRGCLALALVWGVTACGGGGGDTAAVPEDSLVAGLLAAPVTEVQAVRFLYKSSFGPTTASVARLRQLGYARFVDEQLSLPAGRYNDYMLGSFGGRSDANMNNYCASYPQEVTGTCLNWIIYQPRSTSVVFFRSAVHDADQLRMRVAWALSQILVVSSFGLNDSYSAYGMRMYQQMLREQALGNYRDILNNITLNPYMGSWLDLAGSHKNNPNQNYARELLQLFSVGTYRRNPDGTFVYGAQGNRIENYTEDDVVSFARALSGWMHAANFHGSPMVAVSANHDTGSKTLLNGQVVPSGGSVQDDLAAVLDNVFNHPSTGPFVVRQLIQFLVTSNPSPAYVRRVVARFNNNGQGVRGDMKAVVRAILLDTEALNPPDQAGRLLEPVLALTGLVRGVGGTTDGAWLDSAADQMQQRPFAAPSVFNYYAPDQLLPLQGERRHAPQFGIVTTSSVIKRLNVFKSLIFTDTVAAESGLPKYTNSVGTLASGTALQWPSAWIDAAASSAALVDLLNNKLAGGVLEPSQRARIVSALGNQTLSAAADRKQRLRMATWLVMSSPQFMAQR